MIQLTKSRTVALGTLIGAVFVTGVATAAWTADGTGEGQANAGEALAVTSVGAEVSDLLYPTGTADVKLTISNDNPYNVEVTAINNVDPVAITSGDATCDASDSVTFTDKSGSWVVPAGGELNVLLDDAASMSNDSDDACQNEAFTIDVALVGASTASPASVDGF